VNIGSHGAEAVQPEFFARNTVIVARDLIGHLLVRNIGDVEYVSIIVETEAYREEDPASHSFRGPTNRNCVMFGPPGVAYVYRSYGVHHCLNVATENEGIGCAVLIRAVEPVGELESLWRRRFPASVFVPQRAKLLTNGPGKLTQAYAITVERFNGHPFDVPPLRIVAPVDKKARTVVSDVRIGISHGKEKAWRFIDANSGFISRSVTHR
jgi:DNA-3-methyladenine glycosylase